VNALFVTRKPPFVTSNAHLGYLKRRYGVKKAGFSGTLDPFATGTLIIAFGEYTKLFRFLRKYPKRYRATLWLGAKSATLDLEGVSELTPCAPKPPQQVREAVESFAGEFTYTPPIFSAKKVGGKRAYQLAHRGETARLSPVTSTIHTTRLLSYRHPFVTFEADVSEGTYIRSLGEAIAKRLGCEGSLCYLERLAEGDFVYENERFLDPLEYLATTPNTTTLPKEAITHGKPIRPADLAIQKEGRYHLVFDDFFTIIEVAQGKVRYLLNRIPRMTE